MDFNFRFRTRVSTLALSLVLATGLAGVARSGTSTCLLESRNEPCVLLTEPLVRSALGKSATAQLESKSYSATPKPPRKKPSRLPPSNISSCTYSWPSSMKRSIKMPGNQTMEVPRDAELSLTGIVEYPKEPQATFERTHRTPTAEELSMLNKRVEEGLAKAEAEGKVNSAGRNVGKGLAKQALTGITYTAVSGLGDAATWESNSSQLSVLVGAVKFDVRAMVGEDAGENERIAKAIAAGLISECH